MILLILALYMTNKSLVNFFAILFVISIPFSDIPRFPIQGITWSFLLGSIFLFLYFFISGNFERKLAISSYPFVFYFLFLVVYITSYLYNVNNLGDKGVNHILLYMISFCIYYFCFYLALDYLGKNYVLWLNYTCTCRDYRDLGVF